MTRNSPILHRDDPQKAPLVGHVKVTREDWLNAARDILVSNGVTQVKVLTLGNRLGVSRSSFYWYFENRKDLLAALLMDWDTRTTGHILTECAKPSRNITEAACNFFRAFVDRNAFDHGLDFAVREWSRRDADIRKRIDKADAKRIKAVTRIFERHGYGAYEADTRGRILYFMQLGYHALEVREPMDLRMSRLRGYLLGFTGEEADEDALREFLSFAHVHGDPGR